MQATEFRARPEILSPRARRRAKLFDDENLDLLSHVLDDWFRIPGTSIRFGIDGIVGLIPGVGDILGGLASCIIVLAAWFRGVPNITVARMVANVAIEVAVGTIPFVGDMFDIAWKANRRNYKLLAGSLHAQPPMTRPDFRRAWIVLSVVALGLVGCEEHTQKAMRGAPEYLHKALSGDILAQKNLIGCYGSHDACGGLYPFDPALSCAWRSVRLSSQTADLTLADEAAFASACTQGDATFQQRIRLAQEDLTRRIYRKAATISVSTNPGRDRLYPSIEAVRVQVNSVLAKAGAGSLPAFGASHPDADKSRRTWKTCSPTVCLDGVVPGWGGGLYGYRATIISDTKPGHDRELAAELAGAGLDAPGITADLLTPAMFGQSHAVPAAGVCWSAGTTGAGQPFAGARPEPASGPCH